MKRIFGMTGAGLLLALGVVMFGCAPGLILGRLHDAINAVGF